jgi:hypothetical protein
MTGPEHYREAERLLAAQAKSGRAGFPDDPRALAKAQVHATLALAAATALNREPGDILEWRDATGQPGR